MGRKSRAVICVLAAVATAVPAIAAREKTGDTRLQDAKSKPLPRKWAKWVDRSLVPTIAGRVRVYMKGCPARPDAVGCVYSKRPRKIYLDRGRADLPSTLYHELGHLYDMHVMRNRHRRAFKRILGLEGQRWYLGRDHPSEQFAEAYSFCARYRRIRSVRGAASFSYDPSPRQHRKICELIRRAGASPKPPQRPPDPPPTTTNDPEPPPQPPDDPDTVPDFPAPPPPLLPPLPSLP